MSLTRPPRIVYLATDAMTARLFLDGQLGFLRQRGFDVTLITGPSAGLNQTGDREGVRVIARQYRDIWQDVLQGCSRPSASNRQSEPTRHSLANTTQPTVESPRSRAA